MNDIALKLCPFCRRRPSAGFHGDDDSGYHYIECTNCRRPAGLEAERFIWVHAETEEDAAAAWNDRGYSGRAVDAELERQGFHLDHPT